MTDPNILAMRVAQVLTDEDDLDIFRALSLVIAGRGDALNARAAAIEDNDEDDELADKRGALQNIAEEVSDAASALETAAETLEEMEA